MTVAALPAYSPRDLAEQFHALLMALDPAVWTPKAVETARATLHRIREGARLLLEEWNVTAAISWAEEQFRSAVREMVAILPDPSTLSDARADWQALYERLSPQYEAMATLLRQQGMAVRYLHPTNWLRSITHLAMGLAVAAAFELILTPTTAILAATAWVIWAWSLETGRRFLPGLNQFLMRIFGPIARQHEWHRVNSATWFGTGLFILAWAAPHNAAVLGLLAISVGDPFAGMIGRRFGKTKIFRGRSLEGSLAFAASAFAIGVSWMLLFHSDVPLSSTILLAATAAITGAVIELLSTIIDDNLAVSVGAGCATAIVQWMLLP